MLTPIFGHRWWAAVVALAFPFLGACYSIMLPRSGVEPLSWSIRHLHRQSWWPLIIYLAVCLVGYLHFFQVKP